MTRRIFKRHTTIVFESLYLPVVVMASILLVGIDTEGNSAKVISYSDTEQVIELLFEDSSFDGGKDYGLFLSDDLTNWIRIDSQISLSESGALVTTMLPPFDVPIFFTIDEHRHVTLTEEEVATQSMRLETTLNSYTALIKANLEANPSITLEYQDIADQLSALLLEIMAEFDPAEKSAFIEALYNSGLLDEMESASNDFSLFAESPDVQLVQQSKTGDGIYPLSSAQSATRADENDQWFKIRLARGWHYHAQAIKAAAATESVGALFAGPSSFLAFGIIATLASVGELAANSTPTCPINLNVYIDEPGIVEVTMHGAPLPVVRFAADFEARSNLTTEALTLGINKTTEKLIELAAKTIPLSSTPYKTPSKWLNDFTDRVNEWLANESFSALLEKLEDLINFVPEKTVWTQVEFDPNYFGIGDQFTSKLSYSSDRAPAIWDFDTSQIQPRSPGLVEMQFFLNDRVCNVELVSNTIAASIESEPPTVVLDPPFYTTIEGDGLCLDLEITGGYSSNITVNATAKYGDVSFGWNNTKLIYMPNDLRFSYPAIVTARTQDDALRSLSYQDTDSIVVELGDAGTDEIVLSVSDGFYVTDPITIPVDKLYLLLDKVAVSLGAPPEGMMQTFELTDERSENWATGTVSEPFTYQLNDSYTGEGGPATITVQLGDLSEESDMILLPYQGPVAVINGTFPGTVMELEDLEFDCTETVTLNGSESHHESGTIVSWDWRWNGGSASGESIEITIGLGLTTVELDVTDENGAVDTTTVDIRLLGDPALCGPALISPGTFTMGSPEDEMGHDEAEIQHQVTLTKPYYMGRTEVTNAQMVEVLNWALENNLVEAVNELWVDGIAELVKNTTGDIQDLIRMDDFYCQISYNGSAFEVDEGKEQFPIASISWYGALAYCYYLTEKEGQLTQAMNLDDWTVDLSKTGFRLPTEAEWEYACRAGTNTAFFTGDLTVGSSFSIDPNLAKAGWYSSNSKNAGASRVAYLTANAWGLWDMHGNMEEWCLDWSNYYEYERGDVTDPTGPASKDDLPNNSYNRYYRVMRGGCWGCSPSLCRSATRGIGEPDALSSFAGFRVVRNASQ